MFNNNHFQLVLLKLVNGINNDLHNLNILIKYSLVEYKYKRVQFVEILELMNKNNKLLKQNNYIKFYLYDELYLFNEN